VGRFSGMSVLVLRTPAGAALAVSVAGRYGQRLVGLALNVPNAPWAYFCLSLWMDPAQDEQNAEWARGFARAMSAYGVGTAYPNFIEPDEGVKRLKESYGPDKYERLVALKDRYDPENLFRLNQNIKPSRQAEEPALA
jgi:FAD/FMN-containing dehydrogenase